MKLLLIRHPPVLDGLGRCYGRLDLAADESQIGASLTALASYAGWPVYSSPALRCRQLATAFKPDHAIWPELQELDFGTWEGQRWDDIARIELDAWAADIWHYRPGNGESAADLRERWHAVVARCRMEKLEHAVFITHAGLIRMALAEQGLIAANERWNRAIAHAQVYEILL